jgi:[ribosomal protein S5]-alanine N-acetyltransferase
MDINAGKCLLRPWAASDKPALVEAANNRKVWRNLTHMFAHPYTEKDADQWLAFIATLPESSNLAIEVDGRVIGSIGAVIGQGIFAKTAEFGYWMGEPWWGRGIGTAAAIAFTRYFMAEHQLHRMQAYVFAWNPASMRVLEKAGFVREAVLERSAVKDGQVVDEVMYALTDRRLHMLRAPLRTQADCQRDGALVTEGAASVSGVSCQRFQAASTRLG